MNRSNQHDKESVPTSQHQQRSSATSGTTPWAGSGQPLEYEYPSSGNAPHPLHPSSQRRERLRSRQSAQGSFTPGTTTTPRPANFMRMTPVERKEASLQSLTQQHEELMRKLAFERQQIVQRQALWLGRVQPPTYQDEDPKTRRLQRLELVNQLTEEQAAAEAMLESLKKGESLAEARRVGMSVHKEMQAIRANAAREPHQAGAASLAHTGPRHGADDSSVAPSAARTPQPSYTGGGTQPHEARSHLTTTNWRGSLAASEGHALGHDSGPRPGIPPALVPAAPRVQLPAPDTGGQQQQSSLQPGARSTLQQQTPQRGAGWASSMLFGGASARQDPRSGRESAAPSEMGGGAQSDHQGHHRAGRASHAAGGQEGSIPRLTLASPGTADAYYTYPANTQPQEPAPAHILELKDQVKALQALVEAQLRQQQQPATAPTILPVPWMPPQFMQTQQQMQPQAEPRDGLPRELLAMDPGLHDMHVRHQREMAVLRMEIDRARTAAELEQIKGMLNDLRRQQGPPPPLLQPVAMSDDAPPQEPLMTNIEAPQTGSLTYTYTGSEEDREEEEEESDEDDSKEGSRFTEDDELILNSTGPQGLGTVVKADVLHLNMKMAGPLVTRGSYRVRVVLYDGWQPVTAGPDLVVGASTLRRPLTAQEGVTAARFNEVVTLRGLTLTPTMMLVFELYVAKQAVASMPSREALSAWGCASVLVQGEILQGHQSVPLYRLPIMMAANRRFSYNGATLEFSLAHQDGEPGDSVAAAGGPTGTAGGAGVGGAGGPGVTGHHEDVPGVPAEAWVRVTRGTPPADPFTPGEGFVVMLDAARFLPANVTITKVTGAIYSSDKQQLAEPFEAVAMPGSDAASPRFLSQASLAQGSDKFDNSTATILFTVTTVDRWSRELRVVGYAALPLFMDPQTSAQPLSKNVRDYVLNAGAFQTPLHIAPPPGSTTFRGDSLEGAVPRVPCASLLVRVMSMDQAKQRRKPPPAYGDRVYDSMRDTPTPVERKLYVKYLQRKPLVVREAARLLVTPPGAAASSAQQERQRTVKGKVSVQAPSQQEGGGLLGGLFRSGKKEAPPGLAPAAENDDDEGPEEDAPDEGPATGGGGLPTTDAELLDWMEARLRPRGQGDVQAPLNYNMASQYYPDLGFYVAVDGALRLPRGLPSAALITFAPPGSFYQDNPVVDDMKVTLEYDLSAQLASPRWTDGYQHFMDVVYEPGLAVFVDVRLLVPTTGTSAPTGWAVLPVFERAGPYVASGTYQLPLFQGVPSRYIIQEFQNKGDVDAVVTQQIKLGRLRPHEDACSVLVRLIDSSRQGQLSTPATAARDSRAYRLPGYLAALGPKFLASMRKELRNKTYHQAKPQNLTEDAWVEKMNECVMKIAGLDLKKSDSEGSEED